MKSKLIKTLIACLIIGAVSAGGYYGYNKFLKAKPAVAAVQYYTVSARKMNLQVNIQGTGAAYAAVTKDVMPSNNGTLKDLSVKVGDTVTAGTKLFTSDSDDVRKSVTSAQNNLNKQNLTLSTDQNSEKVDENRVAMDKLNVADAQSQLNAANQQLNKMTVTAPIGGVVTAVNNSNGDNVTASKAVLSIVDMSSMKVKVSVDELDIEKVKQGQKAEVKFDAIKDKTYEGTVETIAQIGTTSNNVTTYDVVVDITDPTGIKLGMNANVNILVESKDNVLVIPSEALIDRNGSKFVMIPNSDSSTTGTSGSNTNANAAQGNGQQNAQNGAASNGQASQNGQQGQNRTGQGNRTGQSARSGNASAGAYGGAAFSGSVRQVPVKTGMENENYVEITEGLNEGDKILIQLPQTSSTTNNNNNRNGFGGMGGLGGGNFGGGNMGGARTQGAARTSGSNAKGN